MSKVKNSSNKLFYLILSVLTLGLLGFFLLNKQSTLPAQTTSDKVRVAASFYPLAFFASEIGKDKSEVFSVTPNGVEPHEYEPTAQDIAKVQNSKILLLNGSGFEPWAGKMRPDLTDNNVAVVNTTDGIAVKDPHVWLSPVLAKEQVDKITTAYVKVDPQNKMYYETNAAVLKEKLEQLHMNYQTGLQNCQIRDFVTAHAAFNYLADTYHIKQLSISGLSPEEEPSTAKLAEITDFVKDHGIQYIFFESLVDPKLSEVIASETGAKTLILDPIEGISDDNKKQNKNYFSVMEDNLKNLQIALQCTQ